MIIPTAVYFALFCVITTTGTAEVKDNCRKIVVCDNDFRSKVSEESDYVRKISNYEAAVATAGHWVGFKPERYNLRLSFTNATHYTGAIDIVGVTVHPTVRLFINVNANYMDFNYDNVSLTCCSSSQQRNSANICIREMVYEQHSYVFEMYFSAVIRSQSQCNITFPYFRSYARKDTQHESAVGLRVSGDSDFLAVSTTLKMRHAQSIFPCLNFPALKAQFYLCVEYPREFTAISNTPVQSSSFLMISDSHNSQCFAPTPAICPDMLGFALLKDYREVTDVLQPRARLYVPVSNASSFRWILLSYQEVEYYLHETTRLPPNDYVISYVILTSPGAAEVGSSYGLVFLDASSVTQSIEHVANKTFLYEAMMRQYIGGSFTVSRYDEICLQEGLIKYFVRTLYDRMIDVSECGNLPQRSAVCRTFDNPLIGRYDELVRDDYYNCGARAGAFFRGIADIFGNATLRNLVENMFRFHAERTASIDRWDEQLSAVVTSGDLHQYLKSYSESTEPLIIHVKCDGTYLILERDTETKRPGPIPLKVFVSSSPVPGTIIFRDNSATRFNVSSKSSWILIDPDGSSCARISLDDELYATLLNPNTEDVYGHLTAGRILALANGFCENLLSNKLRFDDEELTESWRKVAEYAYNLNASCRCCLEVPSRRIDCSENERTTCDKLRFVRLLFKNSVSP